MGIFDRVKNTEVAQQLERGRELDGLMRAAGKIGIGSDQLTPEGFRNLTERQQQDFMKLVPQHVEDQSLQRVLAGRIGYRYQSTSSPVDPEIQGMRQATEKLNRLIGSRYESTAFATEYPDKTPVPDDEMEAMIRYERALARESYVSGKAFWMNDDHYLTYEDDVSAKEKREIGNDMEKLAKKLAKDNYKGAAAFYKMHGRTW